MTRPPSGREAALEFPDAAHRPSARDLPSLDGLRALAIGCVILGHATHWSSRRVETLLALLAHFGVCVFFVISGYLITSLLSKDATRRGKVQLRRFYLRRTLRIFPPYYAYLAVVAIGVAMFRWKMASGARWWPALSYASNFFSTNWVITGHSWSLSMEEQFYLTWPFVFAACVRFRGVKPGVQLGWQIAASSLVVFPILRAIVFGFSRDGVLTGSLIFDYVAAGSAIALLLSSDGWDRGRHALEALLRSGATPLVFIVALAMHLAFAGKTRWLFAADSTIVTPIEAVLLAIFIAWAVRNPRHAVGRVLNLRALRVIGVGSYSLYLWQQLCFFGPGQTFAGEWSVSVKLLAAGVLAAASYWIVERPSLRLRARLETTLFHDTVEDKREAGTRLHASPP